MVAAWIGAAYWFTASTSFANPAITIARSLTNTFSGIRPVDVPFFILAQTIGAFAALRPRPRCCSPPGKPNLRSCMSESVAVTIYHNPVLRDVT